LASSSHIVLAGGGLALWENSLTLDRNISFNGTNGWLDAQAGLTFTQPATSTYDGANFIMKRGLGTVVLNGSNAQVGLLVADGVLQINNQAALGDHARSAVNDIQIGGDFAIGGTGTNTRYTGGTLRINADMATTRGIQFNNNGSSIYGGGIDVTGANTFTSGGIVLQGTEFDFAFKTGTGAWVVNSTNISTSFTTANASANVTAGSTNGLAAGMTVSGTGIPAGATISAITGPTTFTLSANATVSATNTLNFVNNNTALRQLAVANGTLQFSNSAPWTNSTGTSTDNTNIEMIGGVFNIRSSPDHGTTILAEIPWHPNKIPLQS
jgi:hypothetical protein